MVEYNVYKDIAERTQGDVYIGVVGPVRTGKSTFIKRFMEHLVLPNIDNEFKKARALDELPQSAGGKMIMTTEPKFIPNEAVEISIGDSTMFNVRMIDCVGYIVNGAVGHIEDDTPRMVESPWYDTPIPFERAAEIGTKKVIEEHSTVGIVVTTDGSISEIPREDYIPAEERVISELKAINKPFVVILNSKNPESERAQRCRMMLEEKYGVKVISINCMTMESRDIGLIMQSILYEFPVCEVSFYMPEWITALPDENVIKSSLCNAVFDSSSNACKIADAVRIPERLRNCEYIDKVYVEDVAAGKGSVNIKVLTEEQLYYDTVKEQTGFSISDKCQLLVLLQEMSKIKHKYEKIASALEQVNQVGYGIVTPDIDELELEEPEIVKQGSRFGVRLKASAPSIHMICNKPKFLKTA